jgi:RecB family exonuclease
LSFQRLQDDALRELTRHSCDLGRRVWVLVPTNLMALHLMRSSGARARGVAGVEFLTLRDAARELAGPSLAGEGLRPLPAGAARLVVERALAAMDDGAGFAAVRGFPGSTGAVVRAIRLLANSLWTPSALERAAGELTSDEAHGDGRLAELAALWREFQEFKRDARLFDDEDLLRRATCCPESPGPHVVFLYGFYDLTPLQQRLVAAVLGPADVAQAFLLWHEEGGKPAPGFEYAAPTLEWLKSLLGVERVDCLGQEEGVPGDLHRLRSAWRAVGALERVSERPATAFDGSVQVLSCPGEVAEAEQMARELLRLYGEAARSQVPTAAVLCRWPPDVAGEVKESLDRAGFPTYVHEGTSLSRTIPGRVLLGLVELAASKAERSNVIALLSDAELPWPEGLSPTALDGLSRRAGIVRGWDEWTARLGNLAGSLLAEAGRSDHPPEAAALRLEAEQCRLARGVLDEFFQAVRSLTAAGTWSGTARGLADLTTRYTHPADAGRREVLRTVDALGRLDLAGIAPTPDRVARLLGRLLDEAGLRAGEFGRSPVTLCGIMASRGTTHDVVLLPRLIERSFPRRGAADPILSDRDREVLTSKCERLGCGRLPVARRRPLEERYLFRVALGSARRRLVLLYPRVEQHTGRPRIFSRFVHEVCEAVCGRPVEASEIEEGTLEGLVRRVRVGPAAAQEAAVDLGDYDLSVFASTPDRELAVGYTSALSDAFRRATQMEQCRWGLDAFGPYDGKLSAPDLLALLREKYARLDSPLSPSRLETYAKCPFHYFMRYVLEVEEFEKPMDELDVTPSERGQLMHSVLCQTYRAALKGRKLGELDAGAIETAMAGAAEAVDRHGAAYADARPALWAAERERMLTELRGLIEAERTANGDAVPTDFELSFGLRGEHGPCRLRISPELVISVRGRIDRVDELGEGAIQVIDYKTGRARGKANSLAGGRQLQLPLYLLAAAEIKNAREGRARYLYVRERKLVDEFTLEALRAEGLGELQRAIRLIAEGIAAGEFFPLPAATPAVRPGECWPRSKARPPAQSVCMS